MSRATATHRSGDGRGYDRSNDESTAVFVEMRPRLIGIAYRILGSWSEAEDIAQDAWLRWQGCDGRTVDCPTAFLVTMTTRLAINVVTSARVRREGCAGEWLPEPVAPTGDASLGCERREAVEMAISMLHEHLAPVERAAFVLRHAFDYPYPTIVDRLGTTEVNARQIVSRAGRRLSDVARPPVVSREHGRLVLAFVAAHEQGEMRTIEEALVADLVATDEQLRVATAA